MVYIRVDMNEKIATGHLMRCIAIADALKELNEKAVFIIADENPISILEQYGYEYHVLYTVWNHMEGEAEVLLELIKTLDIKKILIDSYQVTEEYLSKIQKSVKVAYIDDINAIFYPVDMLICYANYWKQMDYPKRYQKTKLIVGTKYVPLRKEFREDVAPIIRRKVQNLLILTGGTDLYDVVKHILLNIEVEEYKKIDVICGKYYEKYEELKLQFSIYSNIVFHQNVTDIKKYMMDSDVAISAGGTTLYELCACGIPTISYALADNQIENVKSFDRDNLIDYAGDVRTDDVYTVLNELLRERYSCYQERLDKSRRMHEKVDGLGAIRLAQTLINW